MLDMKRKVRNPFVLNEEGQNHETSEVNFDLPPRFGKREEQEEMMTKVVVRHSSSWVTHKSFN